MLQGVVAELALGGRYYSEPKKKAKDVVRIWIVADTNPLVARYICRRYF